MRTSIIAKNIALFTLIAMVSSCGGGGNSTQTATVAEAKPLVKTAVAAVQTLDRKEEFTGTIQPFTTNSISPSIGVRIGRILVDTGDKVRRGQTLVEMDNSQYLQSEVQLANMQADLERYRALYSAGGISQQQLQQMETQVATSKMAIDNLKENTTLLSPVDGIVSERLYDPGDMYSAATGRILTVIQIDRVKVQVNVSEIYFPRVSVGMPVEVMLDIYPDRVYEGKVSLVYPSLNAATRTFTVEVTIPNGDLTLHPGMFSRVALNFGQVERVVIPDAAVQKQVGSNERYVFVISGGTAHRRTVNPGRIVGQNYEILSGLESGETVAVAGMQKLLDGTAVEVSK